MVGEKGWQFSIKFDGNIIWQFWTKTVLKFLPLSYYYYSYWTRSNPLCRILGVREKILDEASAEFNIIFQITVLLYSVV